MHYSSIDALSEKLRTGEVTPVEVLNLTLERIKRLDPQLQCFAKVMETSARAAAEEATAEISAGAWRSPLHGVPIAVKDLYGTADAPTAFGSQHLVNHQTSDDAEVVKGLKAAGAIIIGKLRMSEAALTDHGVNLPTPINPWDPETWVGTSSSGSAAATAAGLCFGALASDTGGSIRGPGSANGVTGLKPTRGAVSSAGTLPLSRTLDTLGPFARSARDCRILFDAMRRPDYEQAREKTEGFTIGVDPKLLATVSRDVREMIEATAESYGAAGVNLVEVEIPDGMPLSLEWVNFVGVEALEDLESLYSTQDRDKYGDEISFVLNRGRETTVSDLNRIRGLVEEYDRGLALALREADALLMPTLSEASPTNADITRMRSTYEAWGEAIMRLTCPNNFTGHPALAFPTGFTPRGTPLGAQLIGAHREEEILLSLGELFQETTQFHQEHPTAYP